MKRDLPTLTLRDACIARGINPDAPGYKTPSNAWRFADRIIPGVADSRPPRLLDTEAAKRGNARREYTRISAANDARTISDAAAKGEETLAYVAAFCRLNNLKE